MAPQALPIGQQQGGGKPDARTILTLLMQKLHIGPQDLAQLLAQLKQAQSPQQAVAILKSFDRNPETMHQQPGMQPGMQPAAPQRGIAV